MSSRSATPSANSSRASTPANKYCRWCKCTCNCTKKCLARDLTFRLSLALTILFTIVVLTSFNAKIQIGDKHTVTLTNKVLSIICLVVSLITAVSSFVVRNFKKND